MRFVVLLILVFVACTPPVSAPSATPTAIATAAAVSPRPAATASLPTGDLLLFVDRVQRELVLADPSGNEVRHIRDAAVPTHPGLAIDPSGRRVAYWREAPVGFELVVWDSASSAVRVIASESELMPWAAPRWTVDGGDIVTTVATAPSAAPPGAAPARGRMDVVNASGGGARVLVTFGNEYPLVALFADRDLVASFRSGNTNMMYVVLDAKTGNARSATSAASFRFFGAAVDARMAWGLISEFESTRPATLRVWPVDDYAREAARVDVAGAGIPLAWPGRSEVAFSSSTPGRDEIRALDYAGGSWRTAGVVGLGGTPLGFSSDGSMVLLYQSTVSPYHLARIRPDGTLGPVMPYQVNGRRTDPTFEFIGWLHL